jgi:hypothetical protein
MSTVQVTLTLPEDLVEQAQSLGILTDDGFARFLESAINREESPDRLVATLTKLLSLGRPITPEEIQAEIQAEEIRQKRREAWKHLFAMIQEIHAVQPPITQEEIDEEIRAYREEQKKARQEPSNQ